MRQPCIDCGQPTNTTRCPTCTVTHNQQTNARQTRKRQTTGHHNRNYGTTYRRRRQTALQGATHCALCGKPLGTPGDPTQTDHTTPIAHGGTHSPLQPVHRSCNIAKSNRLRNQPPPAGTDQ